MDLKDLKIISKLIHTYGIDNVCDTIDSNRQILSYMLPKNSKTDGNTKSLYFETSESQIFTNCTTSIFILNSKIFDPDILKTNTKIPLVKIDDGTQIQKYLDKAKELLGDNILKILCFLDSGTLVDEFGYTGCNISITELKLMRTLLKKYKVYTSRINSIVCAESEYGKAYVLGKNFDIQLTF